MVQTNSSVNDTVYKEAALAILIKRRNILIELLSTTMQSSRYGTFTAQRSNVTKFRLSGPARTRRDRSPLRSRRYRSVGRKRNRAAAVNRCSARRYLGDSGQVHQSEVDHVRGEYLQVDGLVADPLKTDKRKRKATAPFY